MELTDKSYGLTEIPAGVQLALEANRQDKSVLKWSGKWPVPDIGDKVHINFNELGDGTVTGYFVEYDWMGIEVRLAKAPAWHRKQHPAGTKHHGRALVFGVEISHVTYRGGALVAAAKE